MKKETTWRTAIFATFHCLFGCVIGEILGLLIGVSLGWPVFATIALAVVLAFLVGMTLATRSVMHRQGLGFSQAFKVIFLGEVVSISVMELAMNTVDYLVGGIQAMSIMTPIFWLGLLAAIPAGYFAALPVNYWLLSRELKKCCS